MQICLQMWSEDDGPFAGTHYALAETLCRPRPVSEPRPRIMIGGGGEKKTLRLVAQYADACNLFGGPPEVAHKLDVLRRHCDTVGRDFDEIEVTALLGDLPPAASTAELVQLATEFRDVGVHTLVLGATGPDPAGYLEDTFGPAMDDLTALHV